MSKVLKWIISSKDGDEFNSEFNAYDDSITQKETIIANNVINQKVRLLSAYVLNLSVKSMKCGTLLSTRPTSLWTKKKVSFQKKTLSLPLLTENDYTI